jgi:hypothetical protein
VERVHRTTGLASYLAKVERAPAGVERVEHIERLYREEGAKIWRGSLVSVAFRRILSWWRRTRRGVKKLDCP